MKRAFATTPLTNCVDRRRIFSAGFTSPLSTDAKDVADDETVAGAGVPSRLTLLLLFDSAADIKPPTKFMEVRRTPMPGPLPAACWDKSAGDVNPVDIDVVTVSVVVVCGFPTATEDVPDVTVTVGDFGDRVTLPSGFDDETIEETTGDSPRL